jgi:flagellar biosynthesis protein FlhG
MSSSGSDKGLLIEQLCSETGLEESTVRYYEAAYAELLPARLVEGESRLFDPDCCSILLRMDELIGKGISDIAELRDRLNGRDKPSRPRRYCQVLAVTSGKGGVGKSNMALALGIEFSARGLSTLVLDADLGTANLHILSGVKPICTLEDVILRGGNPENLITSAPGGVGLIAGASGIYQMANLNPLQKQVFQSVMGQLESMTDLLIVDTGAGLSQEVVELAAGADHVAIVATPDLTSLTDAYGMIKTLDAVKCSATLGVIANRVQSVAEGKSVFDRLRLCSERFLSSEISYMGHVYRDGSIEKATVARVPFPLFNPEGRAARCVRKIAAQLYPELCDKRNSEPTLALAAG